MFQSSCRAGTSLEAASGRPLSLQPALEHEPEKWIPVFPRDKRGTRLRGDHAQTKRSSGMTIRREVIALCRFRFEVPVVNSRHPVQELQIGGTGACTHKSRTLTDLAMSALPSEADIRASLQPVCFVPEADSCSATRRYSITSSARASNEGGTVRPSALAVLRLITSSYLVGCSTGRSEGLVPLRIFPA